MGKLHIGRRTALQAGLGSTGCLCHLSHGSGITQALSCDLIAAQPAAPAAQGTEPSQWAQWPWKWPCYCRHVSSGGWGARQALYHGHIPAASWPHTAARLQAEEDVCLHHPPGRGEGRGWEGKAGMRYLTTSMVSQGSLGGEGTLGCCLGLAGLGFWDCSGLNGLLT